MKKYLYYPNLEPPDTRWLKFAVLYLDKFESIVPYSRQHLISDDYRRLANETDLVDLYSPNHLQGERATIKAINETERILSNTYSLSGLFKRINLKRDWQNPESWDYQIYGEKFSYRWATFCEESGIGSRNNDGILLPKELAFLYMTHLAKEISFDRNGNIITDNVEYDNYTSFWRVSNVNSNVRDKFMRGVIDLKIPTDIDNIDFNKLIEFRNQNRNQIKAFNQQIDKVEEAISNGLTEQHFVDDFNNIYLELSEQVILLGLGAASIPFALYTLINNPLALTSEYTNEILGGLSIAVGGYYGVRKALYDKREERLCKKYFANLSRLR